MPSSSPIPSPVQAVLDLFASELGEVRFGDVDASLLARLAADVDAAASVVASAHAALEGARATLGDRQDALLQQAQRALAYARVYAEADEALGARLDAISLPRAARRARPGVDATGAEVLVLTTEPQVATVRPRGRPRKVVAPPATSLLGATFPALERSADELEEAREERGASAE